MKQLHICTANLSEKGAKTLVDIIAWLVAGMAEFGTQVSISSKQMARDVTNVIFEYENSFYKPHLAPHGRDIKLVCWVTEVMEEGRFDDVHGIWDGAQRYRDFMSIIDHYSGFITTVPSNVEILRKIAPTTFFEFGFSERLLTLSSPDQWTHDYAFSGTMTPHRLEFLEKTSGRVSIHVPGGTEEAHTANVISNEEYIDTIRKTAINICLKQHPDWPLPSPTRLARIVHCGSGCALEETSVKTRQSSFFPTFRDVDDFLDKFGAVDRQKIYREAGERLAAYRRALPLRREIERNLAECPVLLG